MLCLPFIDNEIKFNIFHLSKISYSILYFRYKKLKNDYFWPSYLKRTEK